MRPTYRTTSRPLASANGARTRIHAVRDRLKGVGAKRYLAELFAADPGLAVHEADIRGWLSPLRSVPDSAIAVVERMERAADKVVQNRSKR